MHRSRRMRNTRSPVGFGHTPGLGFYRVIVQRESRETRRQSGSAVFSAWQRYLCSVMNGGGERASPGPGALLRRTKRAAPGGSRVGSTGALPICAARRATRGRERWASRARSVSGGRAARPWRRAARQAAADRALPPSGAAPASPGPRTRPVRPRR